ncbi:hypothetical protein EJ05DRAFT_389251 [Pseudovirgaria hyperparasitica]|uniref:SMODS and SLOG-associating 2TM effector domain-containing protein n=1 Tax=Pseudovirgaria hyperparasitica TaxID=470096 RepID=A0A6A6W650_9PEZI|nr:uncharacterized protein EJ05DRAFT_389251 [Pseudovirgaria hyperparasitica]KAF2757430.1 hypothetical protein EJ05DRAFT_389251 [Pseudovirgaria hyperparasitica]
MKKIPFVSSLLKRSMQGDVEKANFANAPDNTHAPQTMSQSEGIPSQPQRIYAGTSRPPAPIGSAVHEFVGTHDRLAHFRRLVGIDSVSTLTDTTYLQRKAPNVGIYTRTVSAEKNCGKLFKFFSIAINGCLGLQIVVAATLTALGAAGGGRSAVTFFGAVNTIIAGFLTYLKGSGLPNRFTYFESEWRKVREYIEQREREFGVETCTLVVEEEARIIELMYENVRADVEANVPDSYTSVTRAGRLDTARVAPLPAIGESHRTIASTAGGFGEKVAEGGHHGLARGLDAVHRGIERINEKMHHHADHGQQELQEGLGRGQQAIHERLSRSQSALESTFTRGQRTVDGAFERANSSRHAALERMGNSHYSGLERSQSLHHGGLDRTRSSYEGSTERGHQGLDVSMQQGLAEVHEKLDMLDKGLRQIRLERKDDDTTNTDVVKRDHD